MAGENIVFLGKYTTLVAAGAYYSDPYEVTGYKSIDVETLAVGINGAPTTLTVTLEQSSDLLSWSTADGPSGNLTVGTVDTRSKTSPARYVRLKITMAGGTSPAVTLWSKGVARDS